MKNKLKIIFLIGFLFSFHSALVSYVNSTFLASFLGERNVGLVYTTASIAAILALLLVPKLLKRIGGYKFLLATALLSALSLLFIATNKNAFSVIFVFIFYSALNSLIIFILDEFLEIFSSNGIVGRERGLYLTIINSAWIIAQIFSGRILSNTSFSFLYLIGFSLMFALFIIAFIFLRKIPDPNYKKVPAWGSIKRFFQNKKLSSAYKMNFLLQFFYAWMIIYTPIYLSAHLNFSWTEIGTIFTIMLVPFVLIQFPLGKYSDKFGERKMLMLGFFIISLATTSLFFVTKHSVYLWALMLFGTRIGAAIVEVMSDIYFFKHVDKEDDGFISIYRNAGPVAYVLAPLIASSLFFLIPSFKFLFAVLGTMMLGGLYFASMIRKNDI